MLPCGFFFIRAVIRPNTKRTQGPFSASRPAHSRLYFQAPRLCSFFILGPGDISGTLTFPSTPWAFFSCLVTSAASRTPPIFPPQPSASLGWQGFSVSPGGYQSRRAPIALSHTSDQALVLASPRPKLPLGFPPQTLGCTHEGRPFFSCAR